MGNEATQIALHKNLTWLASNPRKAEKLYKDKKIVKLLPELEKWRKAHLDFIKSEPTLRDTVYTLQLFDREKVAMDMDENDFSAPQTVDARIDSLTGKLRKVKAEAISLEAEIALQKEQYRIDTDKLREQQLLTQKQLDVSRADIARIELERQRLNDQLKAQGESLRKIAIEKEQHKATIAQQQQQINLLTTTRDTLTKNIGDVRQRNVNLSATLANQKAEADTLRRKLNDAVATINKNTATIQALNNQLQRGNTRFDSLQVVFRQMDAERKAAIEQTTGLELVMNSLQTDLATRRAQEAQLELRNKERLGETVRQRELINQLVAARDSLIREVARLEVEKSVSAERDMRNRLSQSAQQTVLPGQTAPEVAMPNNSAELAEAKKRIAQVEAEKNAIQEQLTSNIKFVEVAATEKSRTESLLGDLQMRNKTLASQHDSLTRVLALAQNKDVVTKLSKSNRTADSLRFELKKADENTRKLAAANSSLQEQMTRRNTTETSVEQQKGELIAREQQLQQQKTALEQREIAMKAQEEKYKGLLEKEKELKQLEQRLKQPQATADTRGANDAAVTAPKPAAPATTSAKPTTAAPTTGNIAIPKNVKMQKIAIPVSENMEKVVAYFSQKGYPPYFEDEKLVYRGVKMPEMGSGTYSITFFLTGQLPNETTQSLMYFAQALNGENITEEKFPYETQKLRLLLNKIYHSPK